MRRVLLFLLLLSLLPAADYRVALPGHRYDFPRDHFNHPDFQTEWWYYTGNVRTAAGHRYGFELVFFRRGQDSKPSAHPSAWRAADLYLAHLALTDIDGGHFQSWRRLNRPGPGIAGVSQDTGRIWNGNWQVSWDPSFEVQTLSAVAQDLRLALRCSPRKPPVIHGENGVSQTGDGAGKAAYYVSFTRLSVDGSINGQAVSGTAWMDHEWFTTLLDPMQRGWDWFSLQLDDSTEFMLFRIRKADATIDPHSSGTFIDAAGRAVPLRHSDFDLYPTEYWTSPKTNARYPVRWHISVPSRHLEVNCVAALPDQELPAEDALGPSYWEGAVSYKGASSGVGYLEMTGYALPIRM
jgi:predicted secreted hydrolase